MTSDAKIGLLLGLVFIFIIAFIINGLPSFRSDSAGEPMPNMMNNQLGIADKERKVSRQIIEPKRPVGKQSAEPEAVRGDGADIRFAAELPKAASASAQTGIAAVSLPAGEKSLPVVKTTGESKPAKLALSKFYVVGDGDSLAVIAKKFYGAQEGNRAVNIERIFNANRRLLKSPDEIYPGQKLIIPLLSASVPGKSKIKGILPSPMLEKVKSIGRRHISTENARVKPRGRYIVREGDSLWRIAAEQLGDGNRYSEIAGLNADILDDEDILSVGMPLKMPAR